MPIYEFICRKCGGEFDRLVPYDWKSTGVTCPECGSTEFDRAVSKVGFSSGNKFVSSSCDATCTTCGTGTCNL